SITGTGSAILAGDVVGSSLVSFASGVTVARDSSVVSNGGRIDFAKAVAGNLVAGLRLDAGYNGVIGLGGSIGTPSLSLGWLEITGTLHDPSSYGAFPRPRSPGI
ncbi:MAG: hypothetical protein ORO03_08700, partial [Alphaproteobacteria bacterium]|nr:hypothetical protein [Alphaproteobacteria bacterium]